MIKEAYVSFEVAKLLKEKGFDIPCQTHYWEKEDGVHDYLNDFQQNWNDVLFYISRPTHQMAMAWLREEHGIEIWSEYSMVDEAYVYTILIKSFIKGFTYIHSAEKYSAYEEAVEAALKYSLENLIMETICEIFKNMKVYFDSFMVNVEEFTKKIRHDTEER